MFENSSVYEEKSGGGAIAPYLEKENSKSRNLTKNDSSVTFAAIKCRCGCVWCPKCFLLRCSKKIAERISSMNWSAVRHVVLTVDPEKFDNNPQKAYEYLVRERKALPQFCRDLERTAGVNVRDWVRVIEWHRNGFPHWHVFIDVEITGKAGKIGHEVIQSYWEHGGVSESYIKSENHFKALTGYFGKNGYFEKSKKHQSLLPEWALNLKIHIRRYDSKRQKNLNPSPKSQDCKTEKKKDSVSDVDDLISEIIGEKKQEWRGYAAAIADCGMSTFLFHKHSFVLASNTGSEFSLKREHVLIPYDFFRAMPGEYVPGVGYVITQKISDLISFVGKFDAEFSPGKHRAMDYCDPTTWEDLKKKLDELRRLKHACR